MGDNEDWMYASSDDLITDEMNADIRKVWESLGKVYFAGYVLIDGEAYDALCDVDCVKEHAWVFKEFRAYFGVSGDVENVFDHRGDGILRSLRDRGVRDASYNKLVTVLNKEDDKVSDDTFYEEFGDALGNLSRKELKKFENDDDFADGMGRLALKVLKEVRSCV